MFFEILTAFLIEFGLTFQAILDLIYEAHAIVFTSPQALIWTFSCVYACTATIWLALILHQSYLKLMRKLFKRPTPRLSDYVFYRSFAIRTTVALSLSIWLAPYTYGVSLILAAIYVIAFPLQAETNFTISRIKRRLVF